MTATDIQNCDILDLIKKNCSNNKTLIKEDINVKALEFGDDLETADYLEAVDIVLAGDVIYDNDITSQFVTFLTKLRKKSKRNLTVLVAMEKRSIK